MTQRGTATRSSSSSSLGGRNTRLKVAVQTTNSIPGATAPSGTIAVYLNGCAVGTYTLDAKGMAIVTLRGRTIFNKSPAVRYDGNVQVSRPSEQVHRPRSSPPAATSISNSPENSNGGNTVVEKKSHPAGPQKSFRSGHKVTTSVKFMTHQHPSHKAMHHR